MTEKNPCVSFSRTLLLQSMRLGPLIPTEATLGIALSDISVQESTKTLRKISELSPALLRGAVRVNCEFCIRFDVKQAINAKNYLSLYLNTDQVPFTPISGEDDQCELTVAESC